MLSSKLYTQKIPISQYLSHVLFCFGLRFSKIFCKLNKLLISSWIDIFVFTILRALIFRFYLVYFNIFCSLSFNIFCSLSGGEGVRVRS